jgi:hypothetical protein
VRAIEDKTLIGRAKADLAARTKEHPYICPIPADAKPHVDMPGPSPAGLDVSAAQRAAAIAASMAVILAAPRALDSKTVLLGLKPLTPSPWAVAHSGLCSAPRLAAK